MRKITIRIDKSFDIAEVHLDNVCLAVGKINSFNPDSVCVHGFGDFKGHQNLALNVKELIEEDCEIVEESFEYARIFP